jgi:N-acetylglutamate synthase-like GNAT family acetyltransferase
MAHCAALYVKVFQQAPWHEIWVEGKVRKNIRKMMSRRTFLGFTAWNNDENAVGYIWGYCLHDTFPLKKVLYIDSLFVDDAYQNIGIGKQLLSTFMMAAKEQNITTIFLLTKKDSVADSFYRKYGFTRILQPIRFRKKILMYRALL